ncbi:hypothetical protein NQ317_001193 [Molorchus minor]|uniref:Uncharacterized protein n=1 Tax=Molorchus minor TaxID=1323400 RepID=A0ABQ9JH01_9CUCU|nr:hypothetical protein NQ317_001193 [Molorchus minor]
MISQYNKLDRFVSVRANFVQNVTGSPGGGILLGRELHPAYRLPPHMEYLYSLQHSTSNSVHDVAKF